MNAYSTFSIILRKPIYTSARSITTARFAPDTPGNAISRKICDKGHSSKDRVILSSHSGDVQYTDNAEETVPGDSAYNNTEGSKGTGRSTITLQWRPVRTKKARWWVIRRLFPRKAKWRTAEFSILDEDDLGGGAGVVFGKAIAAEMGVNIPEIRAGGLAALNRSKACYMEKVGHMGKLWSRFRRKAREKGIL